MLVLFLWRTLIQMLTRYWSATSSNLCSNIFKELSLLLIHKWKTWGLEGFSTLLRKGQIKSTGPGMYSGHGSGCSNLLKAPLLMKYSQNSNQGLSNSKGTENITFTFVQTQKLNSKSKWPKSAVVLEPSLEVEKVCFYLQWLKVWLKATMTCFALSRMAFPGVPGWLSQWNIRFSSGHDLTAHEFEPPVGLCADSSQPASDILSPLSLPLPCSHSISK